MHRRYAAVRAPGLAATAGLRSGGSPALRVGERDQHAEVGGGKGVEIADRPHAHVHRRPGPDALERDERVLRRLGVRPGGEVDAVAGYQLGERAQGITARARQAEAVEVTFGDGRGGREDHAAVGQALPVPLGEAHRQRPRGGDGDELAEHGAGAHLPRVPRARHAQAGVLRSARAEHGIVGECRQPRARIVVEPEQVAHARPGLGERALAPGRYLDARAAGGAQRDAPAAAPEGGRARVDRAVPRVDADDGALAEPRQRPWDVDGGASALECGYASHEPSRRSSASVRRRRVRSASSESSPDRAASHATDSSSRTWMAEASARRSTAPSADS